MRSFVIVLPSALASDAFLLDDVPGTSGRLDIGLRCVRAAMLTSHGLRRDVVVYLVLGGGPRAPRTLRIRADEVRFLRPDERSLAVLAQKVLAATVDDETPGFSPVKPGVAMARGGLSCVVPEVSGSVLHVLDESGADLRAAAGLGQGDHTFFLGGPAGFDDASRETLSALGADLVCVGPVSLHAEDVVAIVSNELDRHSGPPP